jgi:hypothetical protein
MRDREAIQEYLERVADRFTAQELVAILEDNGLIDVWAILDNLEDIVIEGREFIEV